MSRSASMMDYGDLSELNLEDSDGRPITTNPNRSRVSSRPLSRYHSEEGDNIIHVGRPRSQGRHSSESSESFEVNRVDNQDILPHSAHEFGLPSRSHRQHDSRYQSDHRRGYSGHRADYDGRHYRDDGRSHRDDRRSYRDHSRPYRDDRHRDRSYRDDRGYHDDHKHYRDERGYRDDHKNYRDDDPYYRDRSRSRHRSRRHSSRHPDYLEDREGRLPVIIMFDNGRGRQVYIRVLALILSHTTSVSAMITCGT